MIFTLKIISKSSQVDFQNNNNNNSNSNSNNNNNNLKYIFLKNKRIPHFAGPHKNIL